MSLAVKHAHQSLNVIKEASCRLEMLHVEVNAMVQVMKLPGEVLPPSQWSKKKLHSSMDYSR